MDVRMKVRLTTLPTDQHKAEMTLAASYLTNDRSSTKVFVQADDPETIVAEFTIKKARQSDVVDKIYKEFAYVVHDWSESTILFPKRK